jgi:hypothetical protein
MQSRCLFCPSQEASTAGIRLSLTLTVKILLGSVANATQSKYNHSFYLREIWVPSPRVDRATGTFDVPNPNAGEK